MALEVQESSEANDDGPDSRNATENRAAYFMARNIQLIEGWLYAVRRMADVDGGPVNWSFPKTLLSPYCDSPPVHLFADIDEALRYLAIAGRVDAAILVELRRSLDRCEANCADLASLIADEEREEVRANYWGFQTDIDNAKPLLPRIILGPADSVSSWFNLGERVGELLGEPGLPGYRQRFHQSIGAILDDAHRIGCTDLDRVRNLPILQRQAGEISFEGFKRVGELIDQVLLRNLTSAAPHEVWIVLDDKRQVFTYFGVEIPFEKFGPTLDLIRVLISNPRVALSSSTIMKEADSGAEANQAKSYLSRFRRVLKEATERQPPEHFQINQWDPGLIFAADEAARKRAAGKDTWYKLDVPPHRVIHIPIDDPI